MAKKLDNITNPADAFISKTSTNKNNKEVEVQKDIKDLTEEEKKEIAKEFIKNKEVRSKRLNLVITPSTHKALKRVSKEKGVSVNEYINTLLEDNLK